ncbi:DUF1540 domain-containing protein [Occultella aeris]|uniref:DUF1540 domain-containing protein n=2 Tax=Occultella TaxID=2828348 RepID=A0A7M4DEL9_9MICO|nr:MULTISPECIES: DUF1540 domain-containing protein [Occultella]MBZ2198822.1 DUF1540 domain-containing protein [Occultella gossypii]VZO35362.1 hypothetical protein HALOF300_00559 [Occultella aeris]
MTSLADLPSVTECTVAGCSYNHDGCHAAAVTIGGTGVDAQCATFIPLTTKGGLSTVLAAVGACQRVDCVHNVDLECSAPAVRIGAGTDLADCLTFEPRT